MPTKCFRGYKIRREKIVNSFKSACCRLAAQAYPVDESKEQKDIRFYTTTTNKSPIAVADICLIQGSSKTDPYYFLRSGMVLSWQTGQFLVSPMLSKLSQWGSDCVWRRSCFVPWTSPDLHRPPRVLLDVEMSRRERETGGVSGVKLIWHRSSGWLNDVQHASFIVDACQMKHHSDYYLTVLNWCSV